jgi:hypothetical protein
VPVREDRDVTETDQQFTPLTWRKAVAIMLAPAATLTALFLIDPIFGDDIEADHLTQAADHVRVQMDGADTDQVSRTVLPMRNASIIAWVDYDTDDWSMCLFTSDGSPTAEGSNHLIFSGTGQYVVEHGSCPDTRTLDIPGQKD